MGHLALSFFGTFEAKLGNEPLTHFRSAKVQGLLIYLVLTADQTHTRDGLATLFWPEEPETTAKQNLRQSLFRLRKVLGDDDLEDEQPYLFITRSTVQFNTAASYYSAPKCQDKI